jgi:uncharacterized protein
VTANASEELCSARQTAGRVDQRSLDDDCVELRHRDIVPRRMSTPLRTAVFSHDTWHPAAMIQRGLSPLAGNDFAFEWLENPQAWRAAKWKDYDCVVLAKGNTTAPEDQSPWLTPEIEAAFVDHVRSGRGLFLLHAGTCYRGNARLRALTGGAFVSHPPPCPVTLEPRTDHVISDGVQASVVVDEHYMVTFDDPAARVFLETRSEHGVQPAGWTREENGRVCALTPGHTEAVWSDAAFRALVERSLRWTAGLLG